MLRWFSRVGAGLLTFAVGVTFVVVLSAPVPVRTSLEAISADTEKFDGKLVEFETYVQLDLVFDGGWSAGEPMEKPEVFTFLDLHRESAALRSVLEKDLSEDQYYRIRSIVRGRVVDNCRKGTYMCCFGKSIQIEDAAVTPLGEPERYRRPSL